MIDPIVFLAFLPAALALNLTPGADMMFCLAQGARGGARPALAASAGISVGTMVHVTAAGLGLGAVIAAAPWAFDAIRWAGVAYLLWLAWKTLHNPIGRADAVGVRPARAFRDGLVVNLTNLKVILFILAFVPQFVEPGHVVLPQFLVFGAVLAVGGFVINGLVGVFSGGLGRALARNPRAERALRLVSATVFGALAMRLLLEGKQT
ncbi:LysE family translocator [Marimonas arenosa]|uniref:LysE family translocator n=1 Tax=Marimonas arenosa TaxID=1795305 RepID=A0AAE3WFY6_9RHOB|nr:LysE family translocator [Marimonas arenosa]MDQ2091710.1 LysE family translocator [Marimonas arenosa]